jgi:hypothetical protein
VVQVPPAEIYRVPEPSLKTVNTSLFATAETSVVEAVMLVKFVLVTVVPCSGYVFTVPLIGWVVCQNVPDTA